MIDTSYRHCSRSIKARRTPLRRTRVRSASAFRRITRVPKETSQSPVPVPFWEQALADDIPSTPQEPARAAVDPATASTRAVPARRVVTSVRFIAPPFILAARAVCHLLSHDSARFAIGPGTTWFCRATGDAYRRGDDLRPGPRPRPPGTAGRDRGAARARAGST